MINLPNSKNLNFLYCLIISFFPLYFLLGSLIINIAALLLSIIFIFNLKNYYKLLNNKFIIILIFFWLSLIVNLFFSTNAVNGYERAFGFLRFIFLIIIFKIYFNGDYKFKKITLTIWLIIFLGVCLDLIFEKIFGFNTLGYKSYIPGRLAGFLNQELKIGHFFSGFFLICCLSLYKKKLNKNYLYICLVFCIILSLLIGERANFLRVFLISISFILIINKSNFIKTAFYFITLISIISLFIFFNDAYKVRFYGQFIKPIIIEKDFNKIINSTVYGANFDRGYRVFKENIWFGVGIKNFRNESNKEIYKNKNLKFNDQAASTHPHQIHLEFLAETGIFGYFSFLLTMFLSYLYFLKNYFRYCNLFSLAGFLYTLFAIIPIIPSGSFFTTFGATLFWINYAIMISFSKQKN